MHNSDAVKALLKAYRSEIHLLKIKAGERHCNKLAADEYLRRARNLEITVETLEGLAARQSKNTQTTNGAEADKRAEPS